MTQNILKLNEEKTEIILFSSRYNKKLKDSLDIGLPLNVENIVLKPVSSVRDLGVIFDHHLTMNAHVQSITRQCYMHLRNISHIRRHLTHDATKSLIQSLVISRIDYCNALLYGLPTVTVNKLQKVQNTAARIVTKTSRYVHITPILKELHWLPVKSRIQYKLLVHTFKALHGQGPTYIADMLNVYQPNRPLRSQDSSTLSVPRVKTKAFGERCFTNAAPTLWNALPYQLRSASSLDIFKRTLKTHLFVLHFNS